jgi:hypothetical protein
MPARGVEPHVLEPSMEPSVAAFSTVSPLLTRPPSPDLGGVKVGFLTLEAADDVPRGAAAARPRGRRGTRPGLCARFL